MRGANKAVILIGEGLDQSSLRFLSQNHLISINSIPSRYGTFLFMEVTMIIKTSDSQNIMENAHGVDARNLYNKESAMVTVITLSPGQMLKRHITPVDVAFYVLEGEGVVEIGDEKQTVTKDTLIESPKDIVHCWYNESKAPLKFMVIKAPKPTKKTVFVGV